MTRRPRRRHSPAPRAAERSCPCGSAAHYSACCGRLHAKGAGADTAEALMRSRYSAFALGDTAYLLRTWHPRTRPAELDLPEDRHWTRLEITEVTGGTVFHASGTVAFRAHYRDAEGPGVQEETGEFVRIDGSWYYR